MARLTGFRKLTSIDQALTAFFGALKPERLSAIGVSLPEALERVAAENIVARSDLPPVDRSAMDGYAVRAEDTFEAGQFTPRFLKLTKNERIDTNEARQIWTGNPIPQKANAVIMLEHTEERQGGIQVMVPVTPGENVCNKGEDIRKGKIAVTQGTRLKAQHIGLLAALGITQVNVIKRPKVAILSVGGELVDLGRKPKPNQVIDVNRLIISCLCRELEAEPLALGIVKDDLDEICAKLREAMDLADVVLTTGGTSAGHADLVPQAINLVGSPGVVTHGIAMRPGMPTALAIIQNRPIIILPGNPVAAMIGFEVFVRPLLLRFLGVESELRPRLQAKLTRRVSSVLGRQVFLRVHVLERDGDFFAEPIRVKGAGILTTMTDANGYVVIPENREGLGDGELVTVHLFGKVGGKTHL